MFKMFISEYLQFFAPEFTLRPTLAKRQENQNTKEVSLVQIRSFFLETLF